MARPLSTPWPTTRGTVFFDDVASAPTLRRAVRAGRIRRIASHIFSADLSTPAADLVADNIWEIVSHLLPGAVIVDRTAALGGAVAGGMVAVSTDQRSSNIELPGLTVVVRPLVRANDDEDWVFGLAMASRARTLVDNLRLSRSVRGRSPRTLTRAELDVWVEQAVRNWDSPSDVFARGRELVSEFGDFDPDATAHLASLAMRFGNEDGEQAAASSTTATGPIDDETLAVVESAVLALGGSLRLDGRDTDARAASATRRIDWLLNAHRAIGGIGAGSWRSEPNRLPSLELVAPGEVEASLRYALTLVESIDESVARAVGVMFSVLVVDPFADGSEELAMLALNDELSSAGVPPVVIDRETTARFDRARRDVIVNREVDSLLDVISVVASGSGSGFTAGSGANRGADTLGV